MTERIDQFCETLRLKLTNIESSMELLKAKISSSAISAEHEVRKHLDLVKRRVDQERGKLESAHDDLRKWALERRAISDEVIAEWKGKLEKAKLQSRAIKADHYAVAAAALAVAAVDEAEQAALEAWLARKDAEPVQSTKAA
jgi:DNA primase large subunit